MKLANSVLPGSYTMDEHLLQKMRSDVLTLQRQIEAKASLLAEVYGELSTMRSGKRNQTVKEIIGVTPLTAARRHFSQCSLSSTSGFLQNVCVTIDLQNNSSRCDMIAEGKLMHSEATTSSILQNTSRNYVEILKAGEKGRLLVSIPTSLFIIQPLLKLIIDISWISPSKDRSISACMTRLFETVDDVHPMESHVIEIEKPKEWRSFESLRSCNEAEAWEIVNNAMVSLISREFPLILPYEFRQNFSSFEQIDFGEWQLFVGEGCFDGLLVGSSTKHRGGVDRAYSSSSLLLDAFLSRLMKTSIAK